MSEQEYVPFGEEWKKEMGKMSKAIIIEMVKNTSLKLKETGDLLLQAARNLGHPAYEHSFHTHEEIDALREKCFDFLGVPKKEA